ncbi:MAG: hypothetical protein ACE5E5_09505 [Phycisphaerae bacterium]
MDSQRAFFWVQRNRRESAAAQPVADLVGPIAESVLQGALDPDVVDRVLGIVDLAFIQHCRLLVRDGATLEVYVDVPAGVSLMRRRWAARLSSALGGSGRIRRVVFRHGSSGSKLQATDV